MDSKQRDIDEGMRVYKEFEPTWDSVTEEDCDTLLVYLPGFKKEQLRVQLTRTRNLIISGERQTEDNTWTKFRKQFAVSNNCDVNGISARFDTGILYVRQPKLLMSAEKQAEELGKSTVTEPPKPHKPMESEPQPQNSTKDKATIPQAPPRAATPLKPSTNEKEKKMNDELQDNDHKRNSSKIGEKEEVKDHDHKSSNSTDFKKAEVRNHEMEDKRTEEEKMKDSEENASDKHPSDGSVIDQYENTEKSMAEISYKRTVGEVAMMAQRRSKLMVIMALAVLMASVLGMYILKALQFRFPIEHHE